MRRFIFAAVFLPAAAFAQPVPSPPAASPAERALGQELGRCYQERLAFSTQTNADADRLAELQKQVADLQKQIADQKTKPTEPPK